MKKCLPALLSFLALAAAMPVAAKPPRPSTAPLIGHIAEADFSSLQGCDDVVVGVTVKDGAVTLGSTNTVETVEVFANSNNICDIGSSWSFAGTVPLFPGDFTQAGTTSASLEKSFDVSGHALQLSLHWSGASTNATGTGEFTQPATVTGSFLLDGIDENSGDVFRNAELTLVQQVTISEGKACHKRKGPGRGQRHGWGWLKHRPAPNRHR